MLINWNWNSVFIYSGEASLYEGSNIKK